MLIISDFHDYYDTAIGYGIDKKHVYQRKEKVISEKVRDFDRSVIKNNITYEFNKMVVGFAGNLYPFIEARKGSEYQYFYDPKKYLAYIKKEGFLASTMEKKIAKRRNGQRSQRWGFWRWPEKGDTEWFDLLQHKHLEKLFLEHKCPVFVKSMGETVLNPGLAEYDFIKIKDAFTAFQDIYQYIAGVLCNTETSGVETEEKYRIQAHGMDGKYSFRKTPTKRKNKKKK